MRNRWEHWQDAFPIYVINSSGILYRIHSLSVDMDMDGSMELLGYYSASEQRVVNLSRQEFTDEEVEQLYWQTAFS